MSNFAVADPDRARRFHGLNPAMGWLFAVALGLYRQSRKVVLVSLIPIALGHAAAIAVVVYAVIGARHGDRREGVSHPLRRAADRLGRLSPPLGHRHRLRIGLRTGLLGLAWSFVMATAHGAGMMLIPVLMPLAGAGGTCITCRRRIRSCSLRLRSLVHSLAMLITTGGVALIVYEWAGLDFLRRGWINLDLVWTAALIGIGLLVLVT